MGPQLHARRPHAPAATRTRVRIVVVLAVAALLLHWPVSLPADAADPRIERAQQERQRAQASLDEVLQRVSAAQARVDAAESELATLESRLAALRADADAATAAVAGFARAAYRQGATDPTLALLASGSTREALDQARLLAIVTQRSQADYEGASAARIRTRVAADAAAQAAERLRASRGELEQVRQEAAAAVAAAERRERDARATVEAEQAAQAARAARTARRPRPSARASRAAVAPAAPSGGVACPVGQPRSYSDTYGAPRSGGRSHKGTDILAPRGTPIYAYESGVVARTNTSRIGGISIYLQGASGNRYYYTHLQGYVGGLSAGHRVSAGQHIAFNGDTGNARGIPHLHFEVMPGGGGNVNPYPFVRRACG